MASASAVGTVTTRTPRGQGSSRQHKLFRLPEQFTGRYLLCDRCIMATQT